MTGTRTIELRVPVPATDGGADWELAATVHLPDVLAGRAAAGTPAGGAPVLVAIPGSGYGRHYYDLPEPGYSQAAHHTGRGTIVVALDHLGVGDSSIPPLEVTTMATVTAANDAAVRQILDGLRKGTLDDAVAPVEPTAVIGAGQSMGGFILVAMQAQHRTFDGIVVLGAAMTGTRLPQPPDRPELVYPAGTTPEEAAMMLLAATDWRYAFHYEDVLETLVAADLAGGLPVRETAPAWGSRTSPGWSTR
jgi:pimeloyl-ACP methyl ester carboxylesterase